MGKYETCEYDVLIIGSGGAGLRAAVEAHIMGLKTAVVCKSLLGKAHTVMAEGGIAAALGSLDPDNWQTHFKDTMFGGKYVNDWRMAEIHAKESADRVRELEQWGAVFDRTKDGKILQRAFGGHIYRRLCHVGDRTGLEMIRTLHEKAVAEDVDIYMECMITRLLLDGGRIAGAFGFRKDTGRFIVFKAKAVVLAAGGMARIWKITTNSWDCTGDGLALALFAGAELKDMEFIQFHPTGMVWPPGVSGLLVTEAVRGDGGLLTNTEGERFMKRYDPKRMELSTRDLVARSINKEVSAGRGTEHGGVYLDISHKPASYVRKKLPSMYQQFMEFADIDITKQPMEVAPTCHYLMGGVRVHPETEESTVPGLFAAGECAAGLHGGNRLGGNSLSDLLVFGRRAGIGAAEYARKIGQMPSINEDELEKYKKELLAPFESKGKEVPELLHRDLQEMMEKNVRIIRSESGLKDALARLDILDKRYKDIYVEGNLQYNFGWHIGISMRFMLMVARVIVCASLERKESRSSLYRDDFPQMSAEWGKKSVIVKCKEGQVSACGDPLPEMPDYLKKLIQEDER